MLAIIHIDFATIIGAIGHFLLPLVHSGAISG